VRDSSPDRLSSLYQGELASRIGADPERLRLARRELNTLASLMSIVHQPFPSTGLFLDLGCGDRYLQTAVNERELEYKGLDIDTVDFEREPLPLASGSVDCAVSLAVIEHLRDPSYFMSEVFRCLKPGGVVYICTPNFQYDFRNFYNDPTHVKPYTPASLEMLFSLYGFEHVHTFPGLRCKPAWWYQGKWRFWRAFFLLPFRGNIIWAPGFLKGHATSIFAMGFKPGSAVDLPP
jgi:SAM-dependent methyltransferase